MGIAWNHLSWQAGGGGGVTPAELAAVEAKANAAQTAADTAQGTATAAQTAADTAQGTATAAQTAAATAQTTAAGKVSKTGDTMTGNLTVPKVIDGQLVRVFSTSAGSIRSVYGHNTGINTVGGSLGIKIPKITNNTILQLSISVADYGALVNKVMVGGNFRPDGTIVRVSAMSLNRDSVSLVRIAWDGANHWVLFNGSGATWQYPSIAVDIVHSNSTTTDWAFGLWNVQFFNAAAEAALTITSTPVLNKGLIPSPGYAPAARGSLIGASGLFSLEFGDASITRTGPGVYRVTFTPPALGKFRAQLAISSSVPLLAIFNPVDVTIRAFDLSGAPTDADGDVFIWT